MPPRHIGMVADDRAFYLVPALSGFSVDPARESGDKLTRFGPFSSQCRASNVKIRRGAGNEELFRVFEGFPDLRFGKYSLAFGLRLNGFQESRRVPRPSH